MLTKTKSIILGILAAGILMAIPFMAFAQQKLPPINELSGEISSPPEGTVPRDFAVEGTVYGDPIRNLWLVEKIGSNHWPKEPRLQPKNNRWQGEVFEGGHPPQGQFVLLLVDVSNQTSQMFESWLRRGHETGSYPGIPVKNLGDYKRLDTKRYRLAE
jgi:hypothetical protein